MDPEKLEVIRTVLPMISTIAIAGVGGWVITTWMRIKNGYPLDGAWGQADRGAAAVAGRREKLTSG